jgi:topoisomerase IV subunit A
MFNKDLTEFTDSYDGRMQEPVALPAKIPLLLMQGAEGIAVGMATKIMPHNFCELLQAQIAILRGEEFEIFRTFSSGGLLDVSAATRGQRSNPLPGPDRGEGREDHHHPGDSPYGTTTESLIESVEKAARAGKLKIVSASTTTPPKRWRSRSSWPAASMRRTPSRPSTPLPTARCRSAPISR